MGLQSWMIKSWPIIDWFPPPAAEPLPAFLHMSTHLRRERCGAEPCTGSTVWVAAIEGAYAGLAWDWVELRPGVLLLADPNSITCNLKVVDARGRAVPALRAAVSLNTVLHRLPWQDTLGGMIAAARDGRVAACAGVFGSGEHALTLAA